LSGFHIKFKIVRIVFVKEIKNGFEVREKRELGNKNILKGVKFIFRNLSKFLI